MVCVSHFKWSPCVCVLAFMFVSCSCAWRVFHDLRRLIFLFVGSFCSAVLMYMCVVYLASVVCWFLTCSLLCLLSVLVHALRPFIASCVAFIVVTRVGYFLYWCLCAFIAPGAILLFFVSCALLSFLLVYVVCGCALFWRLLLAPLRRLCCLRGAVVCGAGVVRIVSYSIDTCLCVGLVALVAYAYAVLASFLI